MTMRAHRVPLLATLLLTACTKHAPQAPPAEAPQGPTNRIAVPEAVRQNLGIRFAKVERRRVAATLRVPGQFESLPHARREYRAPFAGRGEIRVQPLQRVAAGDELALLDAPAWRPLQRELGDLGTELTVTLANLDATRPLLDAHQVHEQSLTRAVEVVQERLLGLEATHREVGGQVAALTDARVQLAQLQAQRAEAAEQHTETSGRIARLEADQRALRERTDLLLAGAAAMLGTTATELAATENGTPHWRTILALPIRATHGGVVDRMPVASGGLVGEHELVVATLEPDAVRFHALLLQSDLPRVRDGAPCRLLPAGAADPPVVVTGKLQLGTEGDPQRRTLAAFVVPDSAAPFTRAGVAGFVEIETAGSDRPELAIPREAVLPDGLVRVFFRRDPADPDRVIRVEADLGVDDGRWVVVKSGVTDGDEVVTAGAYELVLAGSAAAAAGGHFHADGTFHAGEHK